jgi:hypothetical protein
MRAVQQGRPDESAGFHVRIRRGADARAFDHYALHLLEGIVRNAQRTAPGYAVCDYPDGTLLRSCVTPSGMTYVSVARILPLLAECESRKNPKRRGQPEEPRSSIHLLTHR